MPSKERPILFSAPMIRAIIEGRKSMTRRIVKGLDGSEWETTLLENGRWEEAIKSPWHKGMNLWVRENFVHFGNESDGVFSPVRSLIKYCADNKTERMGEWKTFNHAPVRKEWAQGKSNVIPSIFMPRWASRINLEITEVKVERLQEISEEDAVKEGMQTMPLAHCQRWTPELTFTITNKSIFMTLWNCINKKNPWASNPWVWCISFVRVK